MEKVPESKKAPDACPESDKQNAVSAYVKRYADEHSGNAFSLNFLAKSKSLCSCQEFVLL